MTTTEQFLRAVERKYGLAPDEYRALHYAQGGVCYGCRVANGSSRRLGVDHDHLTGEVRALVCTGSINANTCNRAIARYTRPQLLRLAEILTDPPPARAVLALMRGGVTEGLPSLVRGNGYFDLAEVRGIGAPR